MQAAASSSMAFAMSGNSLIARVTRSAAALNVKPLSGSQGLTPTPAMGDSAQSTPNSAAADLLGNSPYPQAARNIEAAIAPFATSYGRPAPELRVLGAARRLSGTTTTSANSSANNDSPSVLGDAPSSPQASAAGQTKPSPAAAKPSGNGQIVAASGTPASTTKTNETGESKAKATPRGNNGKTLSKGAQQLVNSLKKRDQQVRQHEAAHIAASGGNARGGARFSFQTGPDGRRYAVGGEVSIDTSSAGSPEATVRKMEAVQRGALAPNDPSAQDRSVAAGAAQRANAARQEMQKQRIEKAQARIEQNNKKTGTTETASDSGNNAKTNASSTGNENQASAKTNPGTAENSTSTVAQVGVTNTGQARGGVVAPQTKQAEQSGLNNQGAGLIVNSPRSASALLPSGNGSSTSTSTSPAVRVNSTNNNDSISNVARTIITNAQVLARAAYAAF